MTEPVIALREDITEESANRFIGELEALADADRVTIRIGSYGGSVFSALGMVAAMNRSALYKTAEIESICASAATFIAVSSDRMVFHPGAFYMIHQAQGGTIGNADDMEKQAELLRRIDAMIVDMYVARTGGSKSSWMEALKAETWFDASQMEALGLASVIPGNGEMPTNCSERARRAIANHRRTPASVLNSLRGDRPPCHYSDALRAYQSRCDEITRTTIEDARQMNLMRMAHNATGPAQFNRYARWS